MAIVYLRVRALKHSGSGAVKKRDANYPELRNSIILIIKDGAPRGARAAQVSAPHDRDHIFRHFRSFLILAHL